ncbi:MAG TPA: hypothetical protein VGP68_03530 [Gemmataceae bacterium]|jgi:hypothetical protein|nr:hypothetical protein [Gemmataceae bacterium]
MVQETNAIRQQMASTRCSISEKLDLLERRVVATVEGATTAVADTVETVKESVRDSVHSVQMSLDPIRQADRHPWTTFAVSLGAGYAAGRLLEGGPAGRPVVIDQPSAWPRPNASPHELAAGKNGRRQEQASAWVRHVIEPLEPEIRKLKELGVGMLFGLVRDFLHEAAPESLRTRLTEIVDDVTRKAGGEPVQGPVLEGAFSHPSEKENAYSACSRERRPAF